MIFGAVDRSLGQSELPVLVPEIDLVRAAQSGDRLAFAALVKRHQNAVGAVAYALTGRFNLSDDVAQETFIAVWRGLKSIRRPERFRSFLLEVARRKSLRALRDHRGSWRGEMRPSAVLEH